MVVNKVYKIEVVYAGTQRQQSVKFAVKAGTSIQDAIQQSGLLNYFPEIDLTQQKIGIFSRFCQLTDMVADGDRIEIYRPLTIDPKEARRLRAKIRQQQMKRANHSA